MLPAGFKGIRKLKPLKILQKMATFEASSARLGSIRSAMYQAPAVYPPSMEDIERMSSELNLGIVKKDLPGYHALVAGGLEGYDVMEKYVEPSLPVKYPRTPGYRPSKEENEYNAWYYKTDVRGAAEGPLKDYKLAIKDSIPIAGVPMMHGSRVVEGYVPDYDATVVTRALDAGAVIVGKATCEDLCISGMSFTSHPHAVPNAHDKTRVAGGSSSGCGVVIALGEADMAIANDIGGSIRIPSSFSGIVGLLPSYGLVPCTGNMSMAPSMDRLGTMARTVKDCALLLEAIAGDDDGLDMRQRRIPDQKDLPKYSQLLTGDVSGKKIGLIKEGFAGCEDDVASLVATAAKRLTEKGANVEEVSIPIFADVPEIWAPVSKEAIYTTQLANQGCPIGPPGYLPTSAIDNYFAYLKARSHDVSITGKVMQLRGKYINDNYGMRFYAKSNNLCRLIRDKYNEAFEKFDALVVPTIKFKPPKLPGPDASVTEQGRMALSTITNVCPFNASGHPAITINAGFIEGLPVGLQVAGRYLGESELLNIAYAYEQLLNLKK